MIIVKLFGGLGNQMFQYAAGRRLALAHKVPLKLDLGWFDILSSSAIRPYALGAFAIEENIATKAEIRAITGERDSRIWNKVRDVLLQYGTSSAGLGVIKEKSFSFDESVLQAPDQAYLAGYWQSGKYFEDVADVLRQEFTVRFPLTGRNLDVADHIRSTHAVAIHVRRGDYITDKTINNFHGICGLDYYRHCIRRLTTMVSEPHFFVFSDDAAWTTEHLKIDHPTTYVNHNDSTNGYEDLRLMSLCRHNIIANSSFSWWGAWLNSHPSKLIFAPMQWFNNSDIETGDLIPESWIRL